MKQLKLKIEKEAQEDNQTYENTIEILRNQLTSKLEEINKLENCLNQESKSYKTKLNIESKILNIPDSRFKDIKFVLVFARVQHNFFMVHFS